jgi:hypothetical protein
MDSGDEWADGRPSRTCDRRIPFGLALAISFLALKHHARRSGAKCGQCVTEAYSAARDTMLTRTHTPLAPWECVIANNKKPTRRAIIQHIVHQAAPGTISYNVALPDPELLFSFDTAALTDGRLAG